MARNSNGLSRRYQAALRKYLEPGPAENLHPAGALGRRAMAMGLQTLDLARFHEQALVSLMLNGHPRAPGAGLSGRRELFLPRPSPRLKKRIAWPARPTTSCFN